MKTSHEDILKAIKFQQPLLAYKIGMNDDDDTTSTGVLIFQSSFVANKRIYVASLQKVLPFPLRYVHPPSFQRPSVIFEIPFAAFSFRQQPERNK